MATYEKVSPPAGEKITVHGDHLHVPDHPIIPRIIGDGIGRDIWKATANVVDSAVNKAYGGKRAIQWFDVHSGEAAMPIYNHPLPEDTVNAIREYIVAIKGPLTTPVGGGIRSLNVAFRQILDLYACVRPVRYFQGVPSPVKHPERVNIVIYRENTEDVYSGIEYREGTPEQKKVLEFLTKEMGAKIREDSGIGIKPISITGTKRLVRKAIRHALDHKRQSVTLVHKGNIMKFTEGAFRDWGYELAKSEFRGQIVTEREWGALDMAAKKPGLNPAEMNEALIKSGWEPYGEEELAAAMALVPTHGNEQLKSKIMVKDRIADSMFQQMLLRPSEYDVVAMPNLNGDYMSDATAAQVGGLGMAPGANIGDFVALFEATHGTAPKYADLDKVNPGSLILSAVMMLEYMGWGEAARMIESAIEKTIQQKTVTYDLARQMEGATEVSCTGYGQKIVENL